MAGPGCKTIAGSGSLSKGLGNTIGMPASRLVFGLRSRPSQAGRYRAVISARGLARSLRHTVNALEFIPCDLREGNMRITASAISLAALALLPLNDAFAQAAFPPPPPKVSPAAGVLDMHVHSHPDVFGRNMDDIDVAQLAKARGMRGIVLKNHISETASRAALVMKVVPGLEVFGGIVLNNAVGGVNPSAVEWMHRVYGSRGKVVWLPTFESDKHVKTFSKPDAKGLVVAPNGQVTPEMEAVLK